jgi:predicted nucleotidyltransferase
MRSPINDHPELDLTDQRLAEVLEQIRKFLQGKVKACYLFGSCATKTFRPDSDIDLIIVAETSLPFVKRVFVFEFLLEIFPRVDFRVYTEEEFSRLINDQHHGFWTNIKATMVQIL